MRKCCLNKETFSLENSLFLLVNTTLDFQMSTVLKTNVSEKSGYNSNNIFTLSSTGLPHTDTMQSFRVMK